MKYENEFSIEIISNHDELVMYENYVDCFKMSNDILNEISKIFAIFRIRHKIFNFLKIN